MRASVVGNQVASGSAGVGFAFRSVIVEEVLPDSNICNTMDVQTGEKVQVGLNKRGRDAWPQVGDQWVLNRSQAGHWMLAIKVTGTSAPLAGGNTDTMDPVLHGLIGTLAGLGLVQDVSGSFGFGWNDATPYLGTGWAIGPSSGTVQPARFRVNRGHLEVVGAVHTTSTSPSSTVLTLPTAYRTAQVHRLGCVTNASSAITARLLTVGTDGTVVVTPALTATATDLYLGIWLPTEAITP